MPGTEETMNRTTAHWFLEGLQEAGIEYLFCNLGTDHVPLIEEIARWRESGRKAPTVILCPHENLAVHMAGGYAMCTGRGQAVLVHVDVGAANAAMGLHNLFRTRVPVLLFAGKAPFSQRGELLGTRDTYVNFVQDPYDMASLVRPYVKWAYDLPSGVVAKEVVRRAHSVMHSDPPGPVFLTAAREVLAADCPNEAGRSFGAERYGAVAVGGVDDATVIEIADRLLAARDPMLITSYSGRNPACPPVIDELARLTGMRVYESNPTYLNIPHDSPCFGGYSASPAIADCDFGLLVDVDVPWIPKFARENPATQWVHLDVDVIKKDMPMWGFPSHLRIQADSCRVLRRLLEVVRDRASDDYHRAAQARFAELAKRRQAEAAQAAADAQCISEPMSAAHVAARLNEVIDDEDIVILEAITNVLPVLGQIRRNCPGTLFGNGGGGLGFGAGAALGAKLAYPERTVFHITGDASFCFSGPTPAYIVARERNLPIFTIVLDNGGWGAVKGATLRVYPDGAARAGGDYQAAIADGIRYEKVGEAAGAHGEWVDDPAALPGAIGRCMRALAEGRSAILVARIRSI